MTISACCWLEQTSMSSSFCSARIVAVATTGVDVKKVVNLLQHQAGIGKCWIVWVGSDEPVRVHAR